MVNIHKIKQEMCDIGRRLYAKGFAAANDGNISYRLDDNRILCTPTMHNKGNLMPEHIAMVDMQGNMISGTKKRSSEVFLHIEIFNARPEVKSCVHCHPPHATAFAIAGEPIPQCVMPEVEIFLGDVPTTKYAIPGGKEFAETVLPFVKKANIIVLANHGTVSFGETVERAYWWTEVLDAYCRMLMLARSLGNINYFNEDEARNLLELKKKWGFSDPRNAKGYEDCDICGNDVFRPSWAETGVQRRAFLPPEPMTRTDRSPDAPPAAPQSAPPAPLNQEALIQTITDRVMDALASK